MRILSKVALWISGLCGLGAIAMFFSGQPDRLSHFTFPCIGLWLLHSYLDRKWRKGADESGSS